MTIALDPSELVTLTCTACGMRLMVDPTQRTARLFHHGDGGHRVIPAPRPNGAVEPFPSPRDLRVEVLAVAVRMRDLADDLDGILARLSGVDA